MDASSSLSLAADDTDTGPCGPQSLKSLAGVRLRLKPGAEVPAPESDCIDLIDQGLLTLVVHTELDGTVEPAVLGSDEPIVWLGFKSPVLSCRALTEARLRRIGLSDLQAVLGQDAFWNTVLEAQRNLRQQVDTFAHLCAHTGLMARVAARLLAIDERCPREEIAMTHERLARMLGARRAGVTSALSELQSVGAIAQMRGQVRVVDRGRLASHAECPKGERVHDIGRSTASPARLGVAPHASA